MQNTSSTSCQHVKLVWSKHPNGHKCNWGQLWKSHVEFQRASREYRNPTHRAMTQITIAKNSTAPESPRKLFRPNNGSHQNECRDELVAMDTPVEAAFINQESPMFNAKRKTIEEHKNLTPKTETSNLYDTRNGPCHRQFLVGRLCKNCGLLKERLKDILAC